MSKSSNRNFVLDNLRANAKEIEKYNDREIAEGILKRDSFLTGAFLYYKCYPLFKSVYENYYTGCVHCEDFIEEIYSLVIIPSPKTHKCQLELYRGESTLTNWFKSVCLFYCYRKYNLKKRMPTFESLPKSHEKADMPNDRIVDSFSSIEMDFSNLNKEDAMKIISRMPNKRYQKIIELRYLQEMTNEETAKELGMSMDNYYNKHKLAKEQYLRTLRKEEGNE